MLLVEAVRRRGPRDRSRTGALAREASLGFFGRNLLLGNARRACGLFGRRQSDERRERRRRGWSSRRGWRDGCGLGCARRGPGSRLLRPLLIARAFEGDGLRGPERPCLRLILHKAWSGPARTQHRVRPDQGGNHHDTGDRAVPCKPQRPGFLRSVHGTGPTALRAGADELVRWWPMLGGSDPPDRSLRRCWRDPQHTFGHRNGCADRSWKAITASTHR